MRLVKKRALFFIESAFLLKGLELPPSFDWSNWLKRTSCFFGPAGHLVFALDLGMGRIPGYYYNTKSGNPKLTSGILLLIPGQVRTGANVLSLKGQYAYLIYE